LNELKAVMNMSMYGQFFSSFAFGLVRYVLLEERRRFSLSIPSFFFSPEVRIYSMVGHEVPTRGSLSISLLRLFEGSTQLVCIDIQRLGIMRASI
jgi:hypothetical protein